ncbi:hypothetical protein SEA_PENGUINLOVER67_61 [Mycobacterium phage PenguinLover67]|nr:hypothetical protein SEA_PENGUINLOVER67_61 [Mycobacterium phage PenguinLover67]
MTHNHLPAAPADPGETDISLASTAALTFTLGFVVANPAQAHKHYGGISAIADELSRRARPRPGSAVPTTEFAALMASLPRRIAAAVETMYRADRGQRMASQGERCGTNPANSGKSVRSERLA